MKKSTQTRIKLFGGKASQNARRALGLFLGVVLLFGLLPGLLAAVPSWDIKDIADPGARLTSLAADLKELGVTYAFGAGGRDTVLDAPVDTVQESIEQSADDLIARILAFDDGPDWSGWSVHTPDNFWYDGAADASAEYSYEGGTAAHLLTVTYEDGQTAETSFAVEVDVRVFDPESVAEGFAALLGALLSENFDVAEAIINAADPTEHEAAVADLVALIPVEEDEDSPLYDVNGVAWSTLVNWKTEYWTVDDLVFDIIYDENTGFTLRVSVGQGTYGDSDGTDVWLTSPYMLLDSNIYNVALVVEEPPPPELNSDSSLAKLEFGLFGVPELPEPFDEEGYGTVYEIDLDKFVRHLGNEYVYEVWLPFSANVGTEIGLYGEPANENLVWDDLGDEGDVAVGEKRVTGQTLSPLDDAIGNDPAVMVSVKSDRTVTATITVYAEDYTPTNGHLTRYTINFLSRAEPWNTTSLASLEWAVAEPSWELPEDGIDDRDWQPIDDFEPWREDYWITLHSTTNGLSQVFIRASREDLFASWLTMGDIWEPDPGEPGDILYDVSLIMEVGDALIKGERALSILVESESRSYRKTFTVDFRIGERSDDPDYIITFDPNGGTVEEASRQLWKGEALGTLPIPELEDMVFVGWFTEPEGGIEVFASDIWDEDATFYAQWAEEPEDPPILPSLTIKYDGNGGTPAKASDKVNLIAPTEVAENYTAVLPTLPTATRSGYVFTEWTWLGDTMTSGATIGSEDFTADGPNEITLVAQWKAEEKPAAPAPTGGGGGSAAPAKAAAPAIAPSKNVTEFVTALYKIALGRDPDKGGLENWTGLITSGKMSPAVAVKHFLLAEETVAKNLSHAQFVELLYNIFMGRKSDKGGLDNWVSLLVAGMSRESVINHFFVSPEFTAIQAAWK